MSKRKTHEAFINEMHKMNSSIKILDEYVNAKTKLQCECKIHLIKWYADPLLRGHGCPICAQEIRNSKHKKKTNDEFIKQCKIKNPNIAVLSKYTGILDNVQCKCLKCSGIYLQQARKTIEGVGCPYCAGIRVMKGLNDVATTNKEIIKYFKNKDDAFRYTKGSTKIVTFKCVHCGFEKEYEINKISKLGYFPCQRCSDGISYPNKFSRELLNQLPVTHVQYEYSPDWAKPYRYDNYFQYKGQQYILEMDGGFHYIKYYNSNLSLDETQRIDKLKDKLAIENHVTIIRINCFHATKKYIINNLLTSELNNIFDLSIIDWQKCDKIASKSLINEVCSFYNHNSRMTVKSIAKIFKIAPSTASEYLYKGNELGLCNYKPLNKIPVSIKIDNNEFTFETVSSAIRELSTKYKININKFKTATRNREDRYDAFEISYL